MRVINKSIYLALGVNMEGHKELLGLWMSDNEGAKFWLSVLTELKNRGVQDILIACVDGLKGFPDAIAAAYPETRIQLCIVHMVRNSLKYVVWKDYKAVTADLKRIYQATTEELALAELDRFSQQWGTHNTLRLPNHGRPIGSICVPCLNTHLRFARPSTRPTQSNPSTA